MKINANSRIFEYYFLAEIIRGLQGGAEMGFVFLLVLLFIAVWASLVVNCC